MINWGALGTAVGWLPGAAVGSLVGGAGAIFGWEGFASDACQIGTSQLAMACGDVAGYTFTSMAEFGAAGAAVGGVAGACISGLVSAFGGGQQA